MWYIRRRFRLFSLVKLALLLLLCSGAFFLYRPYLTFPKQDAVIVNQDTDLNVDRKNSLEAQRVWDIMKRQGGGETQDAVELKDNSQNSAEEKHAAKEMTTNEWNNRSKYLPENRHVVFIKVHKAASTTTMNMMLRFAMSHELNVLMLKNRPDVNEVGTHIDPNEVVEHPNDMKFDIMCGHIVFNHAEIAPYFPESTVYVGMVREPFRQFKSAFMYYSQYWKNAETGRVIKASPQDPIRNLLRSPLKVIYDNPHYSILNNRMSVDFGFPKEDFEDAKQNPEKIEEFVSQVHKQFDLVLISEKFDESMVLLRRYMNWTTKDILYLRNNALKDLTNITEDIFHGWWNFSSVDLQNFKTYDAIDYVLYNRSLQIFEERIAAEMPLGFMEEVRSYQHILQIVKEFCGTNVEGTYLPVDKTDWSIGFEVTDSDCSKMALSEHGIVDLARKLQLSRMEKLKSNLS